MIEVYINGCASCGNNAIYLARVKRTHPDVTVYNTRYDGAFQQAKHFHYLESAGIATSEYFPIVVENEGKVITLLKEWK